MSLQIHTRPKSEKNTMKCLAKVSTSELYKKMHYIFVCVFFFFLEFTRLCVAVHKKLEHDPL